MMKKLSILGGVAGTLLCSAQTFAITGTDSVSATFTSTIEVGTCTAQIQNSTGQSVTELPFGDVFKSDLAKQSRTVPFKIAFTGCSGVKSAQLKATAGTGGGCSGGTMQGDSFAGGNSTGFEVWKGAAETGTLMSCQSSASAQIVTISGSSLSVDLTSRIVLATGKTISQVTAGAASAPVTFVVTYQ